MKRRNHPPMRRGALLLEIILALSIMVIALGLMASQLVGGIRLVSSGEQQTRASELTDRMLALLELDQQMMARVFLDQQRDGDFGEQFPGYFWQVTVEPTEVIGLGQVKLEVLYDEDEKSPDIRNAKVVHVVGLLKADPGRIDLQQDFGLSDAQFEQVEGLLPIVGLDPTALDPQALVSLDPALLLEMLPALLPLLQQFLGGALPDGGQLSPEDLMRLINEQVANAGQGGAPGAPGSNAGAGRPGAISPGGLAGGGGAPGLADLDPNTATLEDLIRIRDQMEADRGAGGGFDGDTPKPPQRRGGGNRETVRPLQPGAGDPGGGATRGGGVNRGGGGNQRGGGRGAPIEPSGGYDESGNPRYTVEDLLRLRDQLNDRAGGG